MKSILFPFNIDQDNATAYVTTMDMAKELNAKVIFFTSLNNSKSDAKDAAYLHLLDLHGYYQTNFNNWNSKNKIQSERVILSGDFETNLKDFLTTTFVDWVMPTTAIKNDLLPNCSAGSQSRLVKYTRPHYPNLSAVYCRN